MLRVPSHDLLAKFYYPAFLFLSLFVLFRFYPFYLPSHIQRMWEGI